MFLIVGHPPNSPLWDFLYNQYEEDGVTIKVHFGWEQGPSSRRINIQQAESHIGLRSGFEWLTLSKPKWVVDLDSLRERFPGLKTLDWLRGKVAVDPDIEREEKVTPVFDTSRGRIERRYVILRVVLVITKDTMSERSVRVGDKAMADKIPVVMVSSTVRDLTEHRQAVMDACLRQHMLPKMMEHLAASDDGGLAESMRLVDEADVYLAVLGHRYGHIPKGKTKSITQYEYERATERGIPRLIFIMHEDHPLKVSDVEKGQGGEKLEKFKEKLRDQHTVNFFKSPEELRTLVVNTLAALKSKDSAAPPDPSGSTDDEPVLVTGHLSINQTLEVLQRIGCPCLELKLICRSKRPARIGGAEIHVRGPHILTATQKAFSTDFDYGAGKTELMDEPDFFMGFLPATRPDTPHGFVIERDDLRKFLLPAANGALLYFAEAPPQDVFLAIQHLDGRRETLLRGVDVQRELPALLRMVLDRSYPFNPAIVLPMGFNARSWQLPDIPAPGFLNDKAFHLPPHPRRDETIDEESDRIRLRAKILRAGCEQDSSYEEWLVGLVRGHEDKEVRRDAIVTLRRLATPKVREFFFDLLTSESNENTRELIIRSFAMVGTAEDMPVMERMTRDETSRFCKEAAMVALQYLRHRFVKPDDDAAGQETLA